MLYRYARAVTGPLLRLVCRLRVEGAENVPARGPVIIAANHLSFIDSTFLAVALDRPISFVAKSEYFTGGGLGNRLTGGFMRRIGQIPVERGANRAALGSLETALEVLRRDGVFGIYPEGTRSPDGRLYRGRTGVAWLALSSGAPVVPVGISGTARVLPLGARIPRPGPVLIRFGQPLDLSAHLGRAGEARVRRAVTDEVMRAIGALSGQEPAEGYAPAREPAA